MPSFFGYSNDDLALLSEEELDELNARMEFVRRAMPDGWLDLADELHDAAEMLWTVSHSTLRLQAESVVRTDTPRVDDDIIHRKFVGFSRTYFLLAGFAIENLTKGLLVARDPSHITDGRLSNSLKTHRLTNLLKRLDMVGLTEPEISFAEAAERAIPYWGRYPVPVTKERVGLEEALTAEQRAGYLRLRHRLREILEVEVAGGWDSGVGARIVSQDANPDAHDELG